MAATHVASTFPLALSLLLGAAAAQDPAPVPAPAATTPRTAIALQQDFVAIAKKVMPSIVSVRTFVRVAPAAPDHVPAAPLSGDGKTGWVATTKPPPSDYPGFRFHGAGSGFFVGTDGDVLTCLQPLQVSAEQLVDLVEIETTNGQHMLADVLGIEPTLHLAVLRGVVFLDWARPERKPLRFGDSDATEVGQWLLAFGDPVGPERYLGTGLLVAKPARDCYQELLSSSYMQATMFVHPQAYGGPMVDLDGDVVGILSRLELDAGGTAATSPGAAWALPSKILKGLYESIRAAGTMQSPWLGFSVMSRAEIATTRGIQAFQAMKKPSHGLLLENVFQPSPAAAAGLQPGDFLTHVAGVEIHAPVDFQRQLYLAGVGRKVELKLFREGAVFTKELQIEKRPAAATPR